jgi:hypothetical protein
MMYKPDLVTGRLVSLQFFFQVQQPDILGLGNSHSAVVAHAFLFGVMNLQKYFGKVNRASLPITLNQGNEFSGAFELK